MRTILFVVDTYQGLHTKIRGKRRSCLGSKTKIKTQGARFQTMEVTAANNSLKSFLTLRNWLPELFGLSTLLDEMIKDKTACSLDTLALYIRPVYSGSLTHTIYLQLEPAL